MCGEFPQPCRGEMSVMPFHSIEGLGDDVGELLPDIRPIHTHILLPVSVG